MRAQLLLRLTKFRALNLVRRPPARTSPATPSGNPVGSHTRTQFSLGGDDRFQGRMANSVVPPVGTAFPSQAPSLHGPIRIPHRIKRAPIAIIIQARPAINRRSALRAIEPSRRRFAHCELRGLVLRMASRADENHRGRQCRPHSNLPPRQVNLDQRDYRRACRMQSRDKKLAVAGASGLTWPEMDWSV